jgi:hypothetical protein
MLPSKAQLACRVNIDKNAIVWFTCDMETKKKKPARRLKLRKQLLDRFGSLSAAALFYGVKLCTVSKWVSGHNKPPKEINEKR